MIPRNCYVIFLITDCTVLSDCNFRVDNKNECASSSDFKAHFFSSGRVPQDWLKFGLV